MIRVYEPLIAKNQLKYVTEAVENNQLTFHGQFYKDFKRKLEYHFGQSVVLTTNGSVSLFAMLKCLPDEHLPYVVTSTMTYAATVSQIALAGYTPVLLDCDENFQLDLNQLEDFLSYNHHRIAAVMVPEVYSDCPDMTKLCEKCKAWDVTLLEDSAESFDCWHRRRLLGTFGKAGSFSFFANKVITTGEGGCITTADEKFAAQLEKFVHQNHVGGYWHKGPGTNFRMTNLQAAIGVAQLEDLSHIIQRKREIAAFYREKLDKRFGRLVPKHVDATSEWMPVFRLSGQRHNAYSYFEEYCKEAGIETRPTFVPVHMMEGFDRLIPYDMPKSEMTFSQHFILPCYPAITTQQLEQIVNHVNQYI